MSARETLDQIDLRILDTIQRSSPMSTAELADRVGLSQSPCWRRLNRLKEEGYILDPITRLNAKRLAFNTEIFAFVKLSAHGRSNVQEFAEAVEIIPEIVECYQTMGPFDFLLRVITQDVEDYRQLLFGRLLNLPTVQELNSTMSLGVQKYTTALPLNSK